MIKIHAIWLSTAPLDMRAGTDTALARVVAVFGAAHPHHAYCFANKRANRMKVLVHDGLDALVLGLPWHRIGEAGVIGLT
jgi:transposase